MAKIAKNSGFSRLEIVRTRTFEQKVIETSEILENDFWGIGACSCSLNTCPGCIFVTNGQRDLEIASNERSWSVDVPFDSFGQVHPPDMAEFD